MNTRRTALFPATAVVAALATTACSNGGGGSSSTVLSIASTTDAKAAVEEAIAAFEAENPGVEVKATYAETDSLVTTLRTQLSSGTAPDVLTVWPGYGNAMGMRVLQENGYLADLSDEAFAAKIPSGLQGLSQVDGKSWVLPLTVVGIGAIYNEQAVEAAGAEIPTTFDEVLDFCDAATAAGKVAFALGNQAAWVTQLVNYALVPTTVFQKEPDFDAKMAAGDATFVDSGWTTAFDEYMEMNSRGCFTADSLGTSFEATTAQVAAGDALAVVQVTSVLPGIRDQAPAGTTFSMFALPGDDDAEDTWMPAALGFSLGVNAASKNQELARKFIDFMASDKAMASFATTSGSLPALPTDAFEADPALQILVDFQAEGRTYPFMDQFWPNAKVQQEHLDGVQKVFAGTATIDDVLAAMDAAYAEGVK